ncbi:hypothetical protein PVAG01_02829 [Phlyctema vagabunda]|uniref:Uncharacterized protein n=1 Tax=Phlyctema vagabunda TaxID=108571 RepID=A0ABR4PS72_9HELO
MMATEATIDIAATSSPTPDHDLNKAEAASENALSDHPKVNGISADDGNKHESESEPVDGAVNSASVSISGGSDTEASKAEVAKGSLDDKGHGRTTSTVKKFASFKPVSVNKTFLAAKGATPAVPSKLGDKGSAATTASQTGPTATLSARPRLVAKSGSGLNSSTPRTSTTGSGAKPGAAPDASAVWNKNRPTPPSDPKRFTDEELKQRYGIHLATRLQSDDPGKQANWADIDDDDDDWAPETIEWTDGTKITLPQADEVVAAPTPEPEPVSIPKETKPIEIVKPKSPAPPQPAASPTVKTSTFGSGRAGLVLKGAAEKPTLVAKPPGPPTPVKSPWAPLPPVEKVAPVTIEVSQAQQQQSRFSQRDVHGFQGMPPPAKEIAADDFSRSWRDSNSNASRELYNSQSGRYEPVNDTRRGSTRGDQHPRQPAVLQRHAHQDHPEPSAAFQTHRSSGQDTGYGRRRTSSNVSGGSGLLRRMSRGHDLPPAQELLNTRRGSLAAVSDAPSSPRNSSPSAQPSQRGYHASPAISHASPHPTHGQVVPPTADGVQEAMQTQQEIIEEQKKIMRDKREAAIKRRQDEEAKEDAARKERIRLKLEAMGPPPESKKVKKDAPKEEQAPAPTQIQARGAVDTTAIPIPTTESEPDGEPESAPDALETTTAEARQKPAARPNGAHNPIAPSSSTIPDNRGAPSWQNVPSSGSERFSTWGSAPPPQQSSTRNVWGPPTNDRSLGNGTFNPELGRLPEVHQSTSHPGPIGPPNANRGNGQYQQGRGRPTYESRPAPIGPPNRQQSIAAWNALPEKLAQDDALALKQHQEEIARRRAMEEAGIAPEPSKTVFKDTWRQVTLNEDGSRGKVQPSVTTLHSEQPATPSSWNQASNTGPKNEGPQPQSNEAWRRAGVEHNVPRGDALNSGSLAGMAVSPPVRGSRFFPTRDVRLEEQEVTFERPGSPSPPPPTMAGHPAYDGDVAHPHVSLPRPSPVVKLPPVLAPIGPPKPATFAATVAAPPPPAPNSVRPGYSSRASHGAPEAPRPSSADWQTRINSLIGRKNSPPKSHALAVDSASKNALELPTSRSTATVSFPISSSGILVSDDKYMYTKPAAEECFEEQEMGSLPVIRVPHKAPDLAWTLAPHPKPIPRKFVVSHVTSVDALHFPGNNLISIMLPGQTEAKSVNAPTPRQKSNPRRGRGGASRNPSSTHSRGGRARESPNNFTSPNSDHQSASSSPGTGGRGGYRGRGGHNAGSPWTARHVSTPVHT